jgi:hypothetical protein
MHLRQNEGCPEAPSTSTESTIDSTVIRLAARDGMCLGVPSARRRSTILPILRPKCIDDGISHGIIGEAHVDVPDPPSNYDLLCFEKRFAWAQ